MRRKRIQTIIALDFETTGLLPYHGDRIFAWATCDANGNTFVKRTKIGERDPELQALLDDTSIVKVGHNIKFELSCLSVEGYRVPEDTVWHDTIIMAKMVRNLAVNIALEELVYELNGDPDGIAMKLSQEVKRMGTAYKGYQNIPVHYMDKYQRDDVEGTMLLFRTWEPELAKDPAMWADYLNEIELVKVTQRMEQCGFPLDREGCEKALQLCEIRIKDAERELVDTMGEWYNLKSDDVVRAILFGRIGMPVLKLTEKTKKPCVDKDVIATLRESHPHSILDIVQKHRAAHKGSSTIEGYLKLADDNGVIHPSLKSNWDDTGREACEKPNLQNVSKPDNLKNPWIISGRGCFKTFEDCVLLDIDQSGIELRLIIERAGSAKMRNLMKAGYHPHIVACTGFYPGRGFERCKTKYDMPPELKAMYDYGKNGHFCLCFGGGPDQLADTLMLPLPEALVGYNWYRSEFPEIANLVSYGNERAKRERQIVTEFGRVLRLPHGQFYAWLNYYIQGTAAGIIKRGQVRIDKYLRERWPGVAWMFLTVHDSIMIHFRSDVFWANKEVIYNDIRRLMTDFEEINTPLDVEFKLSLRRWNEGKDFTPEKCYENFAIAA